MRTIIITGASDGIGAAAARQIAGTDNRLILVGRSPEKTRSVAYATGAEYYLADFTKLDEVRDLANELDSACDQIDVLANNAGGMFSGPTATTDGFEKTIQVNHLAPVLLTHLLLNTLLNSQATIVNTSSIGARLFSKLDLQDLNTWDTFTPNRGLMHGGLRDAEPARELDWPFAKSQPQSPAPLRGRLARLVLRGLRPR